MIGEQRFQYRKNNDSKHQNVSTFLTIGFSVLVSKGHECDDRQNPPHNTGVNQCCAETTDGPIEIERTKQHIRS